MTKKLISLLLSIIMVASLFVPTVYATGGEANVSLTVSQKRVSVGDEVSVVLSYGDMTVSSFACGFFFDKEKLECTSIVGADPDYPDELGLMKASGKNPWVPATAVPTVAESNNTGTVGLAVAGTKDAEYAAGVVFTATFTAKVACDVEFTVFEDSDGKDGCKVSAIAEQANVSFSVSKKIVSVGDEVSVVLSYNDMAVSSFACGFFFDKEKFECVSIVGADPEYPEDFGINKVSGRNTWVSATASPTVGESNVTGTVGLAVAGTKDVEYVAYTILTATFVAKAEGNADFILYEDSDGAHGFKSDNVVTKSVEVHNFSEWSSYSGTQHSRTCDSCGKIEYADHIWNAGVITTLATHLEFGVKTFTCTECAGTKTEQIEKLKEHTFSKWMPYDETQHKRECACGATEYAEHNWDEGKITVAATHLAYGVKTYACTDCAATRTEQVEKLKEHTFGKWTENGDDVYHRRVCECGAVEYEEHTWDAGKVTIAATHLTYGVKTYTCTVCSGTKVEQIEKIKEHSFGKWTQYDETQHTRTCACGAVEIGKHVWNEGEITTPATHLTVGVKTYTCVECGATRTEEIPKLLIDIDFDGDVDEMDAELLLKYITGHTVKVNESVIDANGDGEVNIRDVGTILLYIKSLE